MSKINLNEINKFLASLDTGVEASVHVNGATYGSAVMVVDFGTPLKPIKLSTENSQELSTRLRKLTRDILGNRDVNIRVNNDHQNGIFWTSIV